RPRARVGTGFRKRSCFRVTRYTHQELAEVLALEHADEGFRRFFQAVDHILAIFDLALAQPLADVALEIFFQRREIPHDEAAHGKPLAQYRAHQHRRAIGPGWKRRVVVMRDDAAYRHAGEIVQ